MGCSHSDQLRNTEQEQPRPKVVKAGPAPEASAKISNKLALGAGCYWGTEKYVKKGEFIFVVYSCFLSTLRILHWSNQFQKTFKRNFQAQSKKPR